MKRSRSVSFAKKTLVIHHISIDDMADEEIDATWITPEEKKAYQANVVRNLKYMRQRPEAVTEQNGLCERGLEHLRSQASMKTRSTIKKKVVDAVLDEQDYQFDNNLCDDKTIRQAALHFTKISSERALHLARIDAEYVQGTICLPVMMANDGSSKNNNNKTSIVAASNKITNMRRIALTQEPRLTMPAR